MQQFLLSFDFNQQANNNNLAVHVGFLDNKIKSFNNNLTRCLYVVQNHSRCNQNADKMQCWPRELSLVQAAAIQKMQTMRQHGLLGHHAPWRSFDGTLCGWTTMTRERHSVLQLAGGDTLCGSSHTSGEKSRRHNTVAPPNRGDTAPPGARLQQDWPDLTALIPYCVNRNFWC
jgi:hypothetical protein